MEYNARENDKLNSNEEENDDSLIEYRAPVCETCLEAIITNHPLVNTQVKLYTVLDTKPEWMLIERLIVHTKTPTAYDTYQNRT